MLRMDGVIDAVQSNHVQVFIGEKNERCVMLVFEFSRFAKVLWVDDPDVRTRIQLALMFDQLPKLVIAPNSPFAAHEYKHDRLARA